MYYTRNTLFVSSVFYHCYYFWDVEINALCMTIENDSLMTMLILFGLIQELATGDASRFFFISFEQWLETVNGIDMID